jgi:hypothetical protein
MVADSPNKKIVPQNIKNPACIFRTLAYPYALLTGFYSATGNCLRK